MLKAEFKDPLGTMFAVRRNEEVQDPDWAWKVYRPDRERPWTLVRAGHLYRRAGFGATSNQLREALVDGPRKTVEKLIDPEGDISSFNRTYDDYETSVGAESADTLSAVRDRCPEEWTATKPMDRAA